MVTSKVQHSLVVCHSRYLSNFKYLVDLSTHCYELELNGTSGGAENESDHLSPPPKKVLQAIPV